MLSKFPLVDHCYDNRKTWGKKEDVYSAESKFVLSDFICLKDMETLAISVTRVKVKSGLERIKKEGSNSQLLYISQTKVGRKYI